jgi:hypothetical protein
LETEALPDSSTRSAFTTNLGSIIEQACHVAVCTATNVKKRAATYVLQRAVEAAALTYLQAKQTAVGK